MNQLKITYHNNLETGELNILVDYQSSSHTRLAQHNKQHLRFIQNLLERSGILSGSCIVRMQHAGQEIVYRVEAGTWEWQQIEGPHYVAEQPLQTSESSQPPISQVEQERQK